MQHEITDEMVKKARRAMQIEADDGALYPKAEIRAALEAVAPALRAQGMRMAKTGLPDYWQRDIEARAAELEKATP